jgi:hypothetical protein
MRIPAGQRVLRTPHRSVRRAAIWETTARTRARARVVEKVVENSLTDSAPVTAEFTGEVKGKFRRGSTQLCGVALAHARRRQAGEGAIGLGSCGESPPRFVTDQGQAIHEQRVADEVDLLAEAANAVSSSEEKRNSTVPHVFSSPRV